MHSASVDTDPRLLRRIAVRAAGLHAAAPFGRGRGGALRALQHLGYLQIDTISVVARAHEHVLVSRVPGFRPGHLDALVRRREAFEYWAHAAAFMPMEDFRFALPRMQRLRSGDGHWAGRNARVMRHVLDRVTAEGPLGARDFAAPTGHRSGWWSWKPAKHALERLFAEGELMITERQGFEKRYDLPERVLPAGLDTRTPTLAEYARWLVDRARRALGVFSARHVTHLRREAGLASAVQQALQDAMEAGELVRVGLPQGPRTPFYADRAALEGPTPRLTGAPRLLSPFDNFIIHRDRIEALFGFAYQLECYLPAPRRRYGYFTLPLLDGARLLGRADCKAERDRGLFRLRALHLEDHAAMPDTDTLLRAMAPLARYDDCMQVRGEDWGLHHDLGSTPP